MAESMQSDINQALGTLGVLATFSPQLQEHAENMVKKRKIKKEEKALNEQTAAATSTGKPLNPQVEEDIENRTRDLAKRKFELKPTEETYREYAKTLPTKIKEDPEILHEERMEGIPDEARRAAEYDYAFKQAYNNELANLDKQQQAMTRMSRQKEAKVKQTRYWKDYLAKMPYTVGTLSGKVGDLSPEAQKQIASNYTKSQRKTIMDRMDREAQNGK